ncbi:MULTISPECIES: H-NS histone family protein [unclassified Variovorax]|uniref:H-NS histone family protein n=1 Tax=unclassified Variovorax TaxID=663243 RepID=UPI001BD54A9C|nr:MULTISPECIES: H-NS histone family protein [unclassified Variovorax]
MATLSLAEIDAQIKEHEGQIAQLQATAAKQREEEIGRVVQELRRKIAEYRISAKELGLTGKSSVPGRRIAPAGATPTGPTYTGPKGEKWVGGSRGRKPRWLAEQLAKVKVPSEST